MKPRIVKSDGAWCVVRDLFGFRVADCEMYTFPTWMQARDFAVRSQLGGGSGGQMERAERPELCEEGDRWSLKW